MTGYSAANMECRKDVGLQFLKNFALFIESKRAIKHAIKSKLSTNK